MSCTHVTFDNTYEISVFIFCNTHCIFTQLLPCRIGKMMNDYYHGVIKLFRPTGEEQTCMLHVITHDAKAYISKDPKVLANIYRLTPGEIFAWNGYYVDEIHGHAFRTYGDMAMPRCCGDEYYKEETT